MSPLSMNTVSFGMFLACPASVNGCVCAYLWLLVRGNDYQPARFPTQLKEQSKQF